MANTIEQSVLGAAMRAVATGRRVPQTGVKVGDELVTVEGMSIAELDMIFIESILKASSSVDVAVRSVPVRESSTNQRPSSRPPSEHGLPASQHQQVVVDAAAAAASSSSVDTASNDGRPGTARTVSAGYRARQ